MYSRQRLVDLSDFSIKQINDNFSAIFLKLSGNIDTIDLKDNSITTAKIIDGAVTADKIIAGSINIGHLDSDFIKNFPLLDNPVFVSYANELAIVDGHVQENGTLIQQNADTIALQAISIDGLGTDLASLTIRSNEISSVVSDNREYVDNEIVRIDNEFGVVNTTISNQYSSITQRANVIESNVSSLTIKTNGLESSVSSNYSQIRQLSSSVSSKVSYTDYNGVEIASLINQDAYSVTIDANAIDLNGITTIYSSDGSYYTEMYGSDLSINVGRERFSIGYDGIVGWDIYTNGEPIRFNNGSTYFDTDVYFDGYVDFSRADVDGLDAGLDMDYIIECRYSANKCYIDYDGGSRLAIRNDRGYVVGYVDIT